MVSTYHVLLSLITLAFCSSKVLADTSANQMYQIALDQHNQYRREVNPPAADMLEMTWDDELADEAQKWADNCEFAYDPKHSTHSYNYFGQNLYSSNQLEDIVQSAMDSWCTEERKLYYLDQFEGGSCIKDNLCRHYTQVVWATSYKLGMGVSSQRCPSGHYMVVANYAKGGNQIGESPYEKTIGQSATNCPAGSRAGSTKLCEVTDEALLRQAIDLQTTE